MASYAITEPGIYYQAKYINMLACLMDNPSCVVTGLEEQGDQNSVQNEFLIANPYTNLLDLSSFENVKVVAVSGNTMYQGIGKKIETNDWVTGLYIVEYHRDNQVFRRKMLRN